MFTNTQIKDRSKQLITAGRPNAITVGLVFLLISVVLAILSGRLLGVDLSQKEYKDLVNAYASGNFDYVFDAVTKNMPSPAAQIIDFALQLMLMVINYGWLIYLINVMRHTGQACYGNLLDGFSMIGRILVLEIIRGIFIFLWSLLLVIPGIIAAYRYSLASYILIDHPEYTPLQCLRESKRLMDGHKARLFSLQLSMLGWYLLSAIPYVGYLARVWVTPYTSMAMAVFYENRMAMERFEGGASPLV